MSTSLEHARLLRLATRASLAAMPRAASASASQPAIGSALRADARESVRVAMAPSRSTWIMLAL